MNLFLTITKYHGTENVVLNIFFISNVPPLKHILYIFINLHNNEVILIYDALFLILNLNFFSPLKSGNKTNYFMSSCPYYAVPTFSIFYFIVL